MLKVSRKLTLTCLLLPLVPVVVSAQGRQPYPKAITDRLIRLETAMAPPPVNTVFNDPDFGSPMVRVTDQTTGFLQRGSYLRTAAQGVAK
jgi:hypothetical protein